MWKKIAENKWYCQAIAQHLNISYDGWISHLNLLSSEYLFLNILSIPLVVSLWVFRFKDPRNFPFSTP